jgi:hypothetical protein
MLLDHPAALLELEEDTTLVSIAAIVSAMSDGASDGMLPSSRITSEPAAMTVLMTRALLDPEGVLPPGCGHGVVLRHCTAGAPPTVSRVTATPADAARSLSRLTASALSGRCSTEILTCGVNRN